MFNDENSLNKVFIKVERPEIDDNYIQNERIYVSNIDFSMKVKAEGDKNHEKNDENERFSEEKLGDNYNYDKNKSENPFRVEIKDAKITIEPTVQQNDNYTLTKSGTKTF